MSSSFILVILSVYFTALLIIAWFTTRKVDSETFFTGNKQSPWYLVAFGMIGTSLSGVTFVSVPGEVGAYGFTYFQLILGNLAGYLVIANILMPIYYRMNLVSIYSYLETRFGFWSYKTGASFFLLSRTIGSALRLYIAAEVLQTCLFEPMHVPFIVTVGITILLIWVYTYKGGIKTIVWTDSFQTFFLVAAVVISVVVISSQLNWGFFEMLTEVQASPMSKIFHFEEVNARNFFWKQFVSGMFITIAMTGLDQDLMQKNLSCKNISEAKKNMYWFSVIIVMVNFLFLTLGALLFIYADRTGIAVPAMTDQFFPVLALNHLGKVAGIFFLLGITASSYASSDSALTALTTSFCVDFLGFGKKNIPNEQKLRTQVHIGFSLLFLIIIVLFKQLNQGSVIKAVLGIAAYTYGPLLGLFAFGIFNKARQLKDAWVPLICVLAPAITYVFVFYSKDFLGGYTFAYEHLLINGGLTILGLWMISHKKEQATVPA